MKPIDSEYICEPAPCREQVERSVTSANKRQSQHRETAKRFVSSIRETAESIGKVAESIGQIGSVTTHNWNHSPTFTPVLEKRKWIS